MAVFPPDYYVVKAFERILHLFQASRPVTTTDEGEGADYYPKFLSARRLFDLQIADCRWRDIILIEMAIFLQSLLSLSEKSETRAATPHRASGPAPLVLTDEQVRCGASRLTP